MWKRKTTEELLTVVDEVDRLGRKQEARLIIRKPDFRGYW